MDINVSKIGIAKGSDNEYKPEVMSNRFNSASKVEHRDLRYNSITKALPSGVNESNW